MIFEVVSSPRDQAPFPLFDANESTETVELEFEQSVRMRKGLGNTPER